MKYFLLILLIASIAVTGCLNDTPTTYENVSTNLRSAIMIIAIDCVHDVICYRDITATTFTLGCTYVPPEYLNECKLGVGG